MHYKESGIVAWIKLVSSLPQVDFHKQSKSLSKKETETQASYYEKWKGGIKLGKKHGHNADTSIIVKAHQGHL